MKDGIKRELIGALLQTAVEGGESLKHSPDLPEAIADLRKLADMMEQDPDKLIGVVIAFTTHRDDRAGADMMVSTLGTEPAVLAVGFATQRHMQEEHGSLKILAEKSDPKEYPNPMMVMPSDNTIH